MLDEMTKEDRDTLLGVATDSIRQSLWQGQRLSVNPSSYSHVLQSWCATFVTLKIAGTLRGCIGAHEVARPLVVDVVEHAHAAAFHDQRFSAVSQAEFPRLEIQISLLSRPLPLKYRSEEDLIAQLRPGVDGLILAKGLHRSTFLPAVWQQLPDSRSFLANLKIKAGLSVDDWVQVKLWRYTTRSIP